MIRKWIAVNVVNEWYWPVQGPVFDHQICVFCERLKNDNPPDPPGYGTSWQVLLELTCVTCWIRGNGRSPSLRAPAVHGVSGLETNNISNLIHHITRYTVRGRGAKHFFPSGRNHWPPAAVTTSENVSSRKTCQEVPYQGGSGGTLFLSTS